MNHRNVALFCNLDHKLRSTKSTIFKGNLKQYDGEIKNHRTVNRLQSTWFTKSTDTGLIMNYLALAPMKYKRSVVCGMIHRIFRACSNFKTFHESIEKAKVILERNQYPKEFVDKIVEETLNKLVGKQESVDKETTDENDETEKHLFKIRYRGKTSDEFKNSLRKIDAPCQVIFKTKKLKTVLPSLKPSVPTSLKSSLVYKIQCPRCSACYVSYTRRHLISRVKEH